MKKHLKQLSTGERFGQFLMITGLSTGTVCGFLSALKIRMRLLEFSSFLEGEANGITETQNALTEIALGLSTASTMASISFLGFCLFLAGFMTFIVGGRLRKI